MAVKTKSTIVNPSRAATNAHRGLRINVTKNDIENGQPNDPCECAAARCIRRTTGAKEVRVYRNVTYILEGALWKRYTTPASLRLETIVFDRNGNFYPGEYDLEPGPLLSVAAKKKAGARASSSGKNKPKAGHYHKIPDVRPTASMKLMA